MGTYIEFSDFTDKVILDFGQTAIDAKITEGEAEVADIAERFDVETDSIETDPVHRVIKRFSIAWVGQEICFDHMGKNNVDLIQNEKYRIKYDFYKGRVKEFLSQINVQILTGTVTQRKHRGTKMTGLLYRSS